MSESGRRRAISDRREDHVVEQLDKEIQLVRRRIGELTTELSGSLNGSLDLASGRRRDVSPQSVTSQLDYRCVVSDNFASSRLFPEVPQNSDLDIITPSQRTLN